MATLKQIRQSQGLTQAELAQKAHLSSTIISKIENGTPASKKTWTLLFEALGVNPEDVTGVVVKSLRGTRV